MRFTSIVGAAALCLVSATAIVQGTDVARPALLLKQAVQGMPKGDLQDIRVLTATIEPGGQTAFHTHRFPVTVYVLEGAFTLEMDSRPNVTIKAGEAMTEPPNVKMTGYNRSATEPMRVVIFYVSDPDTPFLDPILAAH